MNEKLYDAIDKVESAGDKARQWIYYFIIGIVSLVALVFLPMVGTEVGLAWNIPDTTVGWIVWVAIRAIVSVINVLIFHSFICQGKLNCRNNEFYKKARDILVKEKKKEVLPRSPRKFLSGEYGRKGTTIFFTTAMATVALTQAILSYDWMSLLTYLFTIIMGLVFGVLEMKKIEDYWTDEYYRYALMISASEDITNVNDKKIQEPVGDSSGEEDLSESPRTGK